MNKEQKLHSLVLASVAVVMFLILVSSTASASITEKQITTSGSASMPDIYGNRIVYADGRNGDATVYMYDLSTKKETYITIGALAYSPDIYGNRIVFTQVDGSFYDMETGNRPICHIYMYDLSTKKETQITTSGSADSPHIYDNRIVYSNSPNVNYYINDVYMYDLSTKKETQITTSGSADSPHIYGNRIVYIDSLSGGNNVYMYDISTKKKIQITTSGSAYSPDIYDNRIVYIDSRNGGNNVYMYDLSTKKESQITTSGEAYYLDIYGNSVVWNDVGNPDIYMYDLSTKKETRITTSGTAYYPKIYDNRIVWLDNRNRNPDTNIGTDIYMATVNPTQSEVLKINDFNAKVRCGTVPLGTEFISDVTGTNIVKWRWDFEPPGKDYYSQHAVSAKHTFTKPGKYDITLTVWNAAGQTETLTKKAYIVVKPLSKR